MHVTAMKPPLRLSLPQSQLQQQPLPLACPGYDSKSQRDTVNGTNTDNRMSPDPRVGVPVRMLVT